MYYAVPIKSFGGKNKFAALTSNMKLIGKSFDLDGITMAIKSAEKINLLMDYCNCSEENQA